MMLALAMLFTNMTSAFAFAPRGVEIVSVNDIPGIVVGRWTDEANQTDTTISLHGKGCFFMKTAAT